MRSLKAGDAILVSRDIGSHGACILMARDSLQLGSDLKSDCTTLWPQVEALLKAGITPHALRDATRGGLAAVLNEWSSASQVAIELEESAIPVCDPVRGLCELYGFEPHDLANEGTMVLALPAEQARDALGILRQFNPAASQIGVVQASDRHKVILNNPWGSRRYLELPQGSCCRGSVEQPCRYVNYREESQLLPISVKEPPCTKCLWPWPPSIWRLNRPPSGALPR